MSNAQLARTALTLVAFSTATGAILGSVAVILTVPFVATLGPLLGGIAGFALSPLVVLCLLRKNLVLATTIVFATSFVSTVLVCGARFPIHVLCLSVVGYCTAVIAAKLLLPNAIRTRPGYCCACEYDLTGNVSGACPECGNKPTAVSPFQTPTTSVIWTRVRNTLPMHFAAICIVVISLAVRVHFSAQFKPAVDEVGLFSQLANGEVLIHEPAIEELIRRGKAPLLRALQHQNPAVRRNAVKGLWRLADASALPELTAALEDSDTWVRNWSARAVAQLGGMSMACALIQKRDASTGSVRQTYELTLELIGVKKGISGEELGCIGP